MYISVVCKKIEPYIQYISVYINTSSALWKGSTSKFTSSQSNVDKHVISSITYSDIFQGFKNFANSCIYSMYNLHICIYNHISIYCISIFLYICLFSRNLLVFYHKSCNLSYSLSADRLGFITKQIGFQSTQIGNFFV